MSIKSTNSFKEAVSKHLDALSKKDNLFSESYRNPKKNIDDCITYILNQVKNSGCNGFTDGEIYGMAMHYYDEEKVNIGSKINANVIVNHKVELSENDIEKAKKQALQEIIEKEKSKILNKPKRKKTETTESITPSLFD